jgi:hypothetical protein
MVDVKPLDQIVTKWSTNAGAATTYYTAGALAAATKYATNAGAAGPQYSAGVQAGIARNAYQTGVQQAGATKYSTGIQSKGSVRYAGGITAGKTAFQTGMQGVIAVLQGLVLPPRGATGDPANLQRVAAIDSALRAYATGV